MLQMTQKVKANPLFIYGASGLGKLTFTRGSELHQL